MRRRASVALFMKRALRICTPRHARIVRSFGTTGTDALQRDVPLSVNFHFTQRCNYKCKFCFLNRPTSTVLHIDTMKLGLRKLREAGVRKINFAGGEPFMHPALLGQMVEFCKSELNFPCVQITSNARLIRKEWMRNFGESFVDMMTLSIDSFDENVNKRIGRGRGNHVEHIFRVADLCETHDVRVKLNTVVCSENVDEDMARHILKIRPFRWKVVQMYLVDGMNHNTGNEAYDVPHLAISNEQFRKFVDRHRTSVPTIVEEPNERFVKAYLLLNERMRFLSTSEGGVESDSILDVGVRRAIEQCDFSAGQYMRRGGNYFEKGAPFERLVAAAAAN